MTILDTLTAKQLRKLISIKEEIESLQGQLEAITGSGSSSPRKPRGRRKMSKAGRARIAAAQKARWAKVKAGKSATGPKKRRKMSAAGRAKIAAIAKARWARVKALGKKRL